MTASHIAVLASSCVGGILFGRGYFASMHAATRRLDAGGRGLAFFGTGYRMLAAVMVFGFFAWLGGAELLSALAGFEAARLYTLRGVRNAK